MKWHYKTVLLASTVALSALLFSQGIWIRNSMIQSAYNRDADFQHCFNHSITNLVNELMGKSDYDSPFKIEPLDSVPENPELENTPNVIHMGKPTASENASRLIEAALILLHIEQGDFRLTRLDSLINICSVDRIDKIISANLMLFDSNNRMLDSVRYVSPYTKYQLSKLYSAERSVTSLDKSYIIRAEYRIAESYDLQNMGIATIVSLLASVAIISVLFYLLYILKRRHSQMQHMERSFHGAIHDLKSPLAYVYFSISALEEEELDMGKREALLLTADKVSFLTGKINRILQSGRNFKEIGKERKMKLFLFDMVEQVESEIQTMFPEKEIHFQNNFDVELSIMASPDLLEAVLRILLENAVKYNSTQPVVTIRSRREADTVIIEIEDNGYGIRRDRLRKLFRPYYTTDNKYGTGIGLYYAKSIINAYDGKISVKSVVGKGSTFIIILPNL
ncbi:Signal transduction histidine kinase [Porphyromonadaceae bacterium KH3CP3RA]|nr:Signal transduction histidine kinase [Porphyromonadaceae bacterium KH3CP3RA]